MESSCSVFCSSDEFVCLCRSLEGKADCLSLQVKGGSMFPAIRSGDSVQLQLFSAPGRLVPGDIVLFRKESSLYLHRLISRRGAAFVARGDICCGPDGVIDGEAVLARAVAVVRKGRRIDLASPGQRAIAFCCVHCALGAAALSCCARLCAAVFFRLLSVCQSLRLYRRLSAARGRDELLVRQALPADEEQLRDLYCMAGFDVRRGLEELSGRGSWLVVLRRGRVIAAVTVARDEQHSGLWILSGLEVKPLWRGRGAGKRLLAAVLEHAAVNGAERLGLFVNTTARPARMLYRRCGFTDAGEPPQGYNRGSGEEYLERRLVPGTSPQSRLAREIISRCDSAELISSLKKEGLFYPLYPAVRAGIDVEQRPALQQAYYAQVAASEEFRCRIQPVLDALDARGVALVLLKGPAVDALVYDDGYLRPRLDLDVLVRGADLPVLERELLSLGYAAVVRDPAYPLPEYRTSRVFIRADAAYLPVHVHLGLFNNAFLTADGYLHVDEQDIWQQTAAWQDRRCIRSLQPEADLIVLCEHALKHDFEQRVYLYEIAGVIARHVSCIDWQKLISLARQWKLQRPVYCGLFLACRVAAAPVPDEIIAALKPADLAGAEAKFIRAVVSGTPRRYACFSVYLAMRKGMAAKLVFLLRTLVPRGFGMRGVLSRCARCKTLFYRQLTREKTC